VAEKQGSAGAVSRCRRNLGFKTGSNRKALISVDSARVEYTSDLRVGAPIPRFRQNDVEQALVQFEFRPLYVEMYQVFPKESLTVALRSW
jgi:hypothetical protein